MGIFKRLFGKKPALEIRDPVFGPLTFEDDYWFSLPAANKLGFMITVAAPEHGPTESQRALYSQVRSNLSEFIEEARGFTATHAPKHIDVDASRLSAYSVEIGNEDQSRREEFVLELSDDDQFIIHRVTFNAGKAVDYTFDN